MNIAILGGAGLMGSGTVRDLTSDLCISEITSIHVCDLSLDKCQELIQSIGDVRLVARKCDVTDKESLIELLQPMDLCINAVPTFAGFQMEIFQAAYAARCHYIDYGGMGIYTTQQLQFHNDWRDAGITAVVGVGADPGMSNVLCRAVADKLDRIDKINLYWAAESVGEENPILVPPYSISTVLAEYAQPSKQFLNGELIEVHPQQGKETLELPAPWGVSEFMYSAHSEQLTVPFADGIREKGIREFTWKLHLPHREHEAWVGLVKAGFGDFDEPLEIDGQSISPLDVLTAVIDRNIEKNGAKIPDQDNHEIHFAIGEGLRGEQKITVKYTVTVSPDSIYDDYVDAATSMNASISAQLLINSSSKPGVWAPEEFFNVESYFAELEKRKFSVSYEERKI